MKLDYNQLSKSYDTVRSENKSIIDLLLETVTLTQFQRVLDFGCGTGSYANTLKIITNAQVYGVEPSDGMREKAVAKNPKIDFVKGDHEHIPFRDDFFDFAYMTDVIHHVPDLPAMFKELNRVMKKKVLLCIVTESHAQISNRFFVRYFPSTATVDKMRYPDIDKIVECAVENGFTHEKTVTMGDGAPAIITPEFLALVRAKGYSMFHLIPEDEYREGLIAIEKDYIKHIQGLTHAGESMVWFRCEKV